MEAFLANQYDQLKSCILVYPSNLQKVDNLITNEINLLTVSRQYNNLINILVENGVKVYFLELNDSPSQVFARDIGFLINDLLFISNMKQSVRKTEIKPLIDYAENRKLKYYIMQNNAEGGDVIVHGNKVFIGQGDRTNEDGFKEIETVLKSNNMNFELLKVFFETSKIHLDNAFNILDKDTCILSQEIFNMEDVTKHFSKTILIDTLETEHLPQNIVNLGNNILCSCEKFSMVLKNHGYNATYIKFDEIIKDKGGLGCCVLPMLRTSDLF